MEKLIISDSEKETDETMQARKMLFSRSKIRTGSFGDWPWYSCQHSRNILAWPFIVLIVIELQGKRGGRGKVGFTGVPKRRGL